MTDKRTLTTSAQSQVTPKGTLVYLGVDQVSPSPDNPRQLFDPAPLSNLKDSIRTHGVLVPITVYKQPGKDRYTIVDGQRRFKCVEALREEGREIEIPANIVEAPNKIASLVYMFNIHAFRESWELMPTALSLKEIMGSLGTDDNIELQEVTGLGLAQIERCKKILSYPSKFHELSLLENKSERIPSNFWVELYPLLEVAPDVIPKLYGQMGRDGLTEAMVEKYRLGSIRSVIHFRRIMEALELTEDDPATHDEVSQALHSFATKPELETRETFDGFIRDTKRFNKAIDACNRFIRDLNRSKVVYSVDGRDELVTKLSEVVDYTQTLIERLIGEDPPEEDDLPGS